MTQCILSDQVLARCAQRAADYDRENRFLFQDLDELRDGKYLLAAVPRDFGGLGLNFSEICREQRRLARRSAPTALAVNMHLLATGIAGEFWLRGDKSQEWILEEAARGAIFAYGYSESGNDLEVIHSASRAERIEGGYRFYGHRHFGTLSPVWDWLNTYGMDVSDPNDPKIVHAVLSRDADDRFGIADPSYIQMHAIRYQIAEYERAITMLIPRRQPAYTH